MDCDRELYKIVQMDLARIIFWRQDSQDGDVYTVNVYSSVKEMLRNLLAIIVKFENTSVLFTDLERHEADRCNAQRQ